MAKKESAARRPSRSQRNEEQETDVDTAGNGRAEDGAGYEAELASYLEGRIKPGLNRGSIPLHARSIAKEIADSQRVEAPNPSVLTQAVKVINEGGGRRRQ